MITASIVLYNNPNSEVKAVLKAAISSCIDKIYLIDNSDNDSLSFLSNLSSKIIYIKNINKGYGAGNNVALKLAISKDKSIYHIVLNPDVYFEQGTIELLLEYMLKNKDVGLIIPRVIYPNGDLQHLCKLLPSPFDILFRWLGLSKLMSDRNSRFTLTFTGYNQIMDVPYLSGCFMIMSIEALNDVGIFDERFFLHFEDLDLSRRIHEKYKTIFLPHATIVHAHAATHKVNLKILYIAFLSAIQYFNKWGWFFDKKRKSINNKVLKDIECNRKFQN